MNWFLFLIILTFFPMHGLSASESDSPYSINRIILDTGFQCWYKEMPESETIFFKLLVKVGTRYETKNNNGISHFIEHLVFDGNSKWKTEREVEDAVTSKGGWSNAITDMESTVYTLNISTEELEFAMDWLKELMFSPSFKQDEIDRERKVIFQEIGMETILGIPIHSPVEIMERKLFCEDTVTYRVLGWKKILRKISREMILDYYRKYYVPENMVLVVVGNFRTDELINTVKNVFGSMPASGKSLKTVITPPPLANKFIEVKSGARGQIRTGFRTEGKKSKDTSALLITTDILHKNLFNEIRTQRGYSYAVGAETMLYSDYGYISAYAEAKSGDIRKIREIIEREFESLKRKPVDEESLSSVKKYRKNLMKNTFSNNMAASSNFCGMAVYSLANEPLRNRYEEIDKVTAQDIVDIAHKYFNKENSFLLHNYLSVNLNHKSCYFDFSELNDFLKSNQMPEITNPLEGMELSVSLPLYTVMLKYIYQSKSQGINRISIIQYLTEIQFRIFDQQPFWKYKALRKLHLDMHTSLSVGESAISIMEKYTDYDKVKGIKKNFIAAELLLGMDYKIVDWLALRMSFGYYVDPGIYVQEGKGINIDTPNFTHTDVNVGFKLNF